MNDGYFDTRRDKTFPCFCQACLVGKLESQMSQRDSRYCVDCQPIVEEGYIQLRQHKRYLQQLHNPKIEALKGEGRENYTNKEKTKMSTLNSPTPTVDIFRPQGRLTTYKKKELPELQIKQLHNEGMGSKAIASKLKAEQGIDVSYKTIQRVLSGQRN